jgi:hypothetical protein
MESGRTGQPVDTITFDAVTYSKHTVQPRTMLIDIRDILHQHYLIYTRLISY